MGQLMFEAIWLIWLLSGHIGCDALKFIQRTEQERSITDLLSALCITAARTMGSSWNAVIYWFVISGKGVELGRATFVCPAYLLTCADRLPWKIYKR